ncbi:hypothetical protein BIU82_03865 [Arthrobacter sp. SW1]|uniref:hypothetical protein n=1 Tax=Arthrobacter sp. SW1 TaxID=1920889 RepID=UPI000877B144|nr:hypothetical protein [Arthrobacter sp. SW1]OFI38470.1 hypothetical protein BIU82_03865 [Arthrobacter sp. SW1]
MTRSNMDRDDIVSELMLDAGLAGDAPLKAALDSISSLSTLPVPAPRGELAALLGVPAAASENPASENPASETPDGDAGDELAKRRRLKRRTAVVAGAVVTAMGLGIGGVAAGGFKEQTPEFVERLVAGWGPEWNPAPPSLVPAAPVPDAPRVTTIPAPVTRPAPETAPVAPPKPAAPKNADAPVAAPKAPAFAEKKAQKPPKAKPKEALDPRNERRLAEAARSARKLSSGPSKLSFREALRIVLNKEGLLGGNTVEDILRWLVRLGIRV